MSDYVELHRRQPTRLLCPWDSPGKNTGVGCHALLQGIFPTQESNLCLLHCRQSLYPLSHVGSPNADHIIWHLVISFANIFSHSVGCLFILLMVSCVVQRHSSLIRPIVYFFFYFFYLRLLLLLSHFSHVRLCGTP